MDRPCRSSWTGAHENFQAREYDAGASPTSSEPARKAKDSWTSANTNFENHLESCCAILNESLREGALVRCKWTLSDLLSSLVDRRHLK
jgi:hypothetical protein